MPVFRRRAFWVLRRGFPWFGSKQRFLIKFDKKVTLSALKRSSDALRTPEKDFFSHPDNVGTTEKDFFSR
jgi:hypothetical protein